MTRINLRIPLVFQYFQSRQLAGPYCIRAAHGQSQFLKAPLNQVGHSIKSFLGALVILAALLSPFTSCPSLAQEAAPDAANADSSATEGEVGKAEEVEERTAGVLEILQQHDQEPDAY